MSGLFAGYDEERLRIPSVHSKCDEEQKRLRLAVLDAMTDAGGPVMPVAVATRAGVTPRRAGVLADQMAEANVWVLGAEGEVKFAYPVSGVATSHQVTLADGRAFSAMCVIDAIGSAYTFGSDVDIHSTCHYCGTDVRVSLRDGEIARVEPADARVIHVDLRDDQNWAASC